VHGSLVWGDGLPMPGIYITIISRVVEKTALYTTLVIETVLEKLKELGYLRPGETICMWSDAGPHYRANRFMAICATRWPIVYKMHFGVMIGLEHHSKEDLDRYFSVLDSRLRRYETEHWILTTGDLIKCFEAGAAVREQPKPREIFIDFVPTVHRDDWNAKIPFLKAASLPKALKACHSWTFTLVDQRRKCYLGVDGVTITSVRVRGNGLPGFVAKDGGVFCKIAKEVEADADEPPDADDAEPDALVDTSAEMGGLVTAYLGWRTSYRKNEPEISNLEHTLRRLTKKNSHFKSYALERSTRGHRPRTNESRIKVQEAAAARKSAERTRWRLERMATDSAVVPPFVGSVTFGGSSSSSGVK
jgi:hypothetical protein